jgi:hypothetical protein
MRGISRVEVRCYSGEAKGRFPFLTDWRFAVARGVGWFAVRDHIPGVEARFLGGLNVRAEKPGRISGAEAKAEERQSKGKGRSFGCGVRDEAANAVAKDDNFWGSRKRSRFLRE